MVATNYSEQRKQDALDRGQGEILAKARAVRAAKNAIPVAAVVPVAPAVKIKSPAVKVKAAVPAKTEVAKATVKKTPNPKPTTKTKK